MPPRPSERALRKLVADLAGRPKADIRAVLASLGADERTRVEALMAEYRGEGARSGPRAAETSAASINVEGFSPWLAARVRSAADGAPATDFAMTPHALAALKSVSAAVASNRGHGSRAIPREKTGAGLFDLVSGWLSGPVQ